MVFRQKYHVIDNLSRSKNLQTATIGCSGPKQKVVAVTMDKGYRRTYKMRTLMVFIV